MATSKTTMIDAVGADVPIRPQWKSMSNNAGAYADTPLRTLRFIARTAYRRQHLDALMTFDTPEAALAALDTPDA